MSDECSWGEEDEESNDWITGCGGMFNITDGTPTDNHMRFCCYCGKPIDEVRYEPESDDEH